MPFHTFRRAAVIAAAAALSAGCADRISAPAEALPQGAAPLASTITAPVEDLGAGQQLRGINSGGTVVGYAIPIGGRSQAVIWTPGAGRDTLAHLEPAEPHSMAYSINDAGQIAGASRLSGTSRPVLWNTAASQPQELSPGMTGNAYDLNAAGMVVGTRSTASGPRAFAWTAARGTWDLPYQGSLSNATAVNDSGVVVGNVGHSGSERAARWTANGALHVLPIPGSRSSASDVNLRGDVVGFWVTTAGEWRAFFWSASTGFIDIGTGGGRSALATAINRNGVVVGYGATQDGWSRAWAWTPRSGIRTLARLGGRNAAAYAINRNGRAAGEASDDNEAPRLVRWMVTETNTRPSVSLPAGPLQANETDSLTITATGQDAEGDALVYAWSFGDGGSFTSPASTTGSTIRRRWPDNGSYAVRVIASDPSGVRDTATVTVTIRNVAPTTTFGVPANATEGTGYSLVLSKLVDGAADLSAGIQVSFDCGSGTFGTPSLATRIACPGWIDNDTLAVRVRLRDKDGDSTVYSRSLIVFNAAPVPAISAVSSTTVPAGQAFTARGSFTDRGAADGPWKYRFHWGDNTYTQGYLDAQGAVPATQHVYRAAGTYTPSLLIMDKDGRAAQTAQLTVTVTP